MKEKYINYLLAIWVIVQLIGYFFGYSMNMSSGSAAWPTYHCLCKLVCVCVCARLHACVCVRAVSQYTSAYPIFHSLDTQSRSPCSAFSFPRYTKTDVLSNMCNKKCMQINKKTPCRHFISCCQNPCNHRVTTTSILSKL